VELDPGAPFAIRTRHVSLSLCRAASIFFSVWMLASWLLHKSQSQHSARTRMRIIVHAAEAPDHTHSRLGQSTFERRGKIPPRIQTDYVNRPSVTRLIFSAVNGDARGLVRGDY
jgi:hypothetical protein